MLPPSVLNKGLVARNLPQPAYTDNQGVDVALRLGRYGDIKTESGYPTDIFQADEGAIMVATMNPAQTAIQLGIQTAYVSTQAGFVLGNTDPAGGRRIYPKFLKLAQSVAPTSGVDLRYAIVVDNTNRTPTTLSNAAGGTGPGSAGANTAYRVTVSCTNADMNPTIAGIPYFTFGTAGATGSATVPAPSQFARVIVGNGYIKNSIPVVKDQYVLQFGSCDVGGTFQGAAALAKIVEHVPPVVIGPGQFMTIHLWSASNITAGNAWDDACLCWAER